MGMGRADKQIIQQHTLKKRQRRCEQQRRMAGEKGEGRGMANTAQANKYRKNFLITFFGLICCENNFAGAVWTARYRSVVQRPLVGYSLHNSPRPPSILPSLLSHHLQRLPHVTDIKFFAFTSATSPSPISSAKLKCSRQEEAQEKERERESKKEREIEGETEGERETIQQDSNWPYY